jgi:hypothetical protein
MSAFKVVLTAAVVQVVLSAQFYLPGVSPHTYQPYEAVRFLNDWSSTCYRSVSTKNIVLLYNRILLNAPIINLFPFLTGILWIKFDFHTTYRYLLYDTIIIFYVTTHELVSIPVFIQIYHLNPPYYLINLLHRLIYWLLN